METPFPECQVLFYNVSKKSNVGQIVRSASKRRLAASQSPRLSLLTKLSARRVWRVQDCGRGPGRRQAGQDQVWSPGNPRAHADGVRQKVFRRYR